MITLHTILQHTHSLSLSLSISLSVYMNTHMCSLSFSLSLSSHDGHHCTLLRLCGLCLRLSLSWSRHATLSSTRLLLYHRRPLFATVKLCLTPWQIVALHLITTALSCQELWQQRTETTMTLPQGICNPLLCRNSLAQRLLRLQARGALMIEPSW